VEIDTSVTADNADEGEIVAYGPNVMVGYHNKPEKTKQVLVQNEEGIKGVRTGDLGRMDEDGFLYITGRIKHEYKLTNGKYIHPASIEQYIKLLPWISNAMVYGDNRPYNIALIVPDLEIVKDYAQRLALTIQEPEELFKSKEVQNLISKEIQSHLREKFGGYEIPKKFAYLTKEFTVENGLLTQTLKLKRNHVYKQYQKLIDQMYK
jgi:long-chain acyl-CoA synthetase